MTSQHLDGESTGNGSPSLLTTDFLVLIFSGFFAMAGFASTLPLVPRYVEGELGGSKVAVGVALGIFSVSAVFARPMIGRLGDQRGRRFIIVAGTTLTGLIIAAHALATTLETMYVVRLAMGATQGAFFVGSATLVNDLAPEDRRGEATNYFSVAIYGGMALGPLLGETIERAAGFPPAFVAGGLALGLSSLLALRLPADEPEPEPDTPAAAGTDGVAPPPARGGFLHPNAIVPGLILMGGLVTFTALNGFMPLYVEEEGIGSAGTVLLLYGLLVLVMRVVGSRLTDRFGTLRMGTVSLIGQAAGMAVMWWWVSEYGLYAATAILAIGGSFLYPTLLTAAIHGVPRNERARATSTFTLAFELSAGLGGPILGIVAAAMGTGGAFLAAAVAAAASIPVLYVWAARQPDALVPPRPAAIGVGTAGSAPPPEISGVPDRRRP